MIDQIEQSFIDALGKENVLSGEPMSRHVSFQIGGPADYFITPADREGLKSAVRICRDAGLPFFIFGNGSNLLVSDEGYRGAVIQLCRNCKSVTVKEDEIHAQAGASLARVSAAARDAGLAGMEFAAGIPGTVGGAVYMNAGAYGGEISQVLTKVTTLSADGHFAEYSAEEMEFSYRNSRIRRTGEIVWEAVFRLSRGVKDEIAARMLELARMRNEKQPLEYPSAGSTFKRPEGYFAGKLIMDAGLKGFRIGGAEVSQKHSGFIINAGGATAMDVYRLMAHVRMTVFRKYGVVLMPEVRLLGEFREHP